MENSGSKVLQFHDSYKNGIFKYINVHQQWMEQALSPPSSYFQLCW
ncbi:hypothetical protein D1AOALGA4SA_1051 [Olavius algarvensis Delta 1 endosymbiont]|nr:hypothetical protein D1AOALGA4SA_1051 [Olavius algarvensis Delta 1 endosymbiont]